MTVANGNTQTHTHICVICHDAYSCTIEECAIIEFNIDPICLECEEEMDADVESEDHGEMDEYYPSDIDQYDDYEES